jgi:adenylate kinase family enzyme
LFAKELKMALVESGVPWYNGPCEQERMIPMNIDPAQFKPYLTNVYFVNGTAAAGKSTTCKALAKRHGLILCEENYSFDVFLERTTPATHPHMNYFRTKPSWEAFVSRSKEEYEAWLDGVALETTPFELLELMFRSSQGPVIVDTNIPPDILEQVASDGHLVYMVATPEIAVEAFFQREDEEKQFLRSVMERMEEPQKALSHYDDIIRYINRQERIDAFHDRGVPVVVRHHLDDDIEDKIAQVEQLFGLVE